MTQAQANEMTRRFIEGGMNMVQALATTMSFVKVAEITATGYVLTQANLAEIASNARQLAEGIVSRNEAAQGSAFLAQMGA